MIKKLRAAADVRTSGIDPGELLAYLHAQTPQHPELGREVMAFGLGSGDPDLVQKGRRWAATAHYARARDETLPARQRITHALEVALLESGNEFAHQARLLAGELEMTDGDPDHATEHLEAVYREADWNRSLPTVVSAAIGLSNLYRKQERRREAAELFVQILGQVDPDRIQETTAQIAYAYALVELAAMHREAGRTDLQRQLIRRAADYLRQHGEEELAVWAENR
ncbi:MAG: hypothetical protein Q4G50_02015 [Corynebacterium sp.]|uniref:hypothetical protein n=1 Tax=Corynebacterium sp. TaxID=1720 RepID=UPI0026E0A146|nr:hypothetical protein [Corynebacterium sp.]MDO5668758.1 hypothetical protein [Corynebacterium sp.]